VKGTDESALEGPLRGCLDDDQLDAAVAAALPDVVVADHVAVCAECRARLAARRDEAVLLADVRRIALAGAATTASVPAAPEVIAGYKILRQIGEGGMGAVYEAEQPNPRRRVALKVLRRGIASRRAMRRLEHEAQVLGRLRHPHIARVLEAGTFDDHGAERPFFAMELIEGPTLQVHAATLDLRAKLALLRDVCSAVHHAHQNGVIHRDLKPGNILVDALEGPKVLDFGVALCADARARSDSLRTLEGQLVGTLAYMAPEQLEADGVGVDVRTDVWALGVIAYELLAGRLPHDVARLPVTEVVRRISEDEPPRLGTLAGGCRGDIETVVHRALERDRARRYQSALELAQDIDRVLTHQPILARPPSALYQLRKLARRHRALASAAFAVFLALLVGLSTTTWQWLAARAAERTARLEAEKAKRVSMFWAKVVDPAEGLAGQDTTVRAVLERAASELEAEQHEPLVAAELSFQLGNALRSVGALERAEGLHRRCLELRRSVLAPADEAIGEALNAVAMTVQDRGQAAGAASLYQESLDLFRTALGAQHPKVGRAWYQLGTIAQADAARADEAARCFEAAVACWRAVLALPATSPADARDTGGWLGNALANLAVLASRRGDRDRSFTLSGEALAAYADAGKAEHPYAAIVESNYARALEQRGEFAEAERRFVASVATLRRAVGDDHPWTKPAVEAAARFFEARGQPDRAAAIRQPAAR